MDLGLISVVVSAYNAEKYIDRCIESIINQTYANLEIVLVDNGSTDGTASIVDKWERQDSRIRVMHKVHENGFNGKKAGVLSAQGEYIGFVDSDDYIENDFFECLATHIQKYDLVMSNYKVIYANGKSVVVDSGFDEGEYSSEDNIRYILSNMLNVSGKNKVGIFPNLWTKLYKRDLLQEVYSGTQYEHPRVDDAIIVYKYMLRCNSIYIVKTYGYNYFVYENSVSHSRDIGFLKEVADLFGYFTDLYSKHPLRLILQRQLEGYISYLLIDAEEKMGFDEKYRIKSMIFPFIYDLTGKRIALYGSGEMGKNYYYQICRRAENNLEICDLAMWVSKNYDKKREDGLPLCAVSELLKGGYDYVVIAVGGKSMAEEIKDELIEMGINKDKLLWREPINLLTL